MTAYPYHKEQQPVLINVEIGSILSLTAILRRNSSHFSQLEIRCYLINGVKIVFYSVPSLNLYILYWK